MFYFVLVGFFALVGLGALLVALFSKKSSYGPSPRVPALVTAAIAGLLIVGVTAAFSFTTVSARSVGIETAFGKYVDTLDNGPHWTAPWANVEEFSTLNQPLDVKEQTVSFAGTKIVDVATKQVTTSGSGGGGVFNGRLMWAVNEDGKGVEKLWKLHKSYDNVRDNVVNPAFREAGRVVIGAYSPVEAKDGANLRPINEAVLKDLKNRLEPLGIVVASVTITDINLDSAAQNSLNRIVEANANTERAKSERERAGIDADTQKIRNDSGLNNPTALARYCLDVVNNWNVEKNGSLPAGFSCVGAAAPFVVSGGNQPQN